MRREQKIVAIGAASGVAAMLAGLVLLSPILPNAGAGAGAGDRLAFAAQWMALPALPLFLMLAAVGNARFRSDAIDPTLGKEQGGMAIDGRVAANTVEQYLLFLVAGLAIAAAAPGDRLGLVAAASIVFTMARFAFWIGYRIHPLHRAFGMAATSYLNLVLLLAAAWFAWES